MFVRGGFFLELEGKVPNGFLGTGGFSLPMCRGFCPAHVTFIVLISSTTPCSASQDHALFSSTLNYSPKHPNPEKSYEQILLVPSFRCSSSVPLVKQAAGISKQTRPPFRLSQTRRKHWTTSEPRRCEGWSCFFVTLGGMEIGGLGGRTEMLFF